MMDHDPSVLPRPFRVVSNTRLTSDVVTIELESTDEGAPIRCEPGQFNMLYRLGVGEVPISASSSPDEPLLGHTMLSFTQCVYADVFWKGPPSASFRTRWYELPVATNAPSREWHVASQGTIQPTPGPLFRASAS